MDFEQWWDSRDGDAWLQSLKTKLDIKSYARDAWDACYAQFIPEEVQKLLEEEE